MGILVDKILINLKRNFKFFSTAAASPIVNVKEGKLQGLVKKLIDGSSYYSFKGIPYCQAPVGELRFKILSEGWAYPLKGFMRETEYLQLTTRQKGTSHMQLCLFMTIMQEAGGTDGLSFRGPEGADPLGCWTQLTLDMFQFTLANTNPTTAFVCSYTIHVLKHQ